MVDSWCPHSFSVVRDELGRRLAEPPDHLVQLLVGPRQVGKTTLLLELERQWAGTSVYAAADAPASALPGWWENLWSRAVGACHDTPSLVLLDEIQYLAGWSRLLKSQLDDLKRRRLPIHIVASGSSALSVSRGSRETMAGRFEKHQMLHWQPPETARCFGKPLDAAAYDAVRLGGYPGTVRFEGDWDRWRAYVRDSIVEPAIGRDILSIEQVRNPALLRQVFAIACGHPAQIVSLAKIRGQLHDSGALETIAHYLELLQEACLVAAVPKYSGKELRRRASPPKLVPLNNALLSVITDSAPPTPDLQPMQWGRWLENACMAAAWNCGQKVYYWREEPLEVDLVSVGKWGSWACEVKTGRLDRLAFRGVLEFCRRYPGFKPMVVCDPGQEHAGDAAGVTCLSWERFLNHGMLPA